jgi:hypothetical protein
VIPNFRGMLFSYIVPTSLFGPHHLPTPTWLLGISAMLFLPLVLNNVPTLAVLITFLISELHDGSVEPIAIFVIVWAQLNKKNSSSHNIMQVHALVWFGCL